MSDKFKTYRAREKGFDGIKIRKPGEVFTTDVPQGKWMDLLDKDGNVVERPAVPAPVAEDGDVIAAKDARIAELEAQLAAAKTGGKAPAAKTGGKGKADAGALDHDKDGKKGGVANPNPVSDEEKHKLFEGLTDDELRQFVEDATKSAPAADATREQLIEAALAN